MAKQILVKTPQLENGVNPLFGPDGKMMYTESILVDNGTQSGARAILEKRNSTLPTHMKVLISDYEEPVKEEVSSVSTPPAMPVIPLLDQLKLQAENESLKAQLKALKPQQETVTKVKLNAKA